MQRPSHITKSESDSNEPNKSHICIDIAAERQDSNVTKSVERSTSVKNSDIFKTLSSRQTWKQTIRKIIVKNRNRNKWKTAVQSIISMKKLFTYYEILSKKDERPKWQLYAAVQLTIFFKGDGDIRPKLLHIKRILQEASLQEVCWDNLTITGRSLYKWITPSKMNEHILWFTSLFAILLLCVYSYMLADYRNYHSYPSGPHVGTALKTVFDFDFLNLWNGFYPYAFKNHDEKARWFISIILHDGLQHIVANLCLFLIVSGDLEHKYGTTRVILISFAAGVGGNLLSAVAEDGCGIVVGASGLIFGLVGFWVADLLINFHFIKQFLFKICLAVCFFILFIITAFSNAHVSNWSHLGGFVSGLFPALLCLPRLGKQRLEAAFFFIGSIGTVLYFSILPAVAIKVVIPKLQCSNSSM